MRGPYQPAFDDEQIVMVTTETEIAQVESGTEAGRQRIHHEAVHARSRDRQAATARTGAAGHMKRIRVLIVDDSVVVRRILRDVLEKDPAIEVVGVAANGLIGLSMVEQLSPDMITLDIEMPEMDGLDVLRQLRESYPRLPVIMFSTLTQRGAEATLDALALGARDYVTKPANVGSVTTGMERIRDDLVPKIKGLCGVIGVVAQAKPDIRPLNVPG